VIVVRAVPPEQRLDSRGELVVVEGLAKIVVGADAQPDHAIGRIVLRREEEDRDIRIAAELEAEANPVDRRHEDVERHEVGVEFVERLHRLTCVGDRFDLMPGVLEDGADQPSDVSIVVDDEDPPA